jgi:hypothetical protein
MAKKKSKGKARERCERRFNPVATASPTLVYAIGAVGAIALGAGVWGQFGHLVREGGPEPFQYAPYILAAGAVLVGIAIWFGTSGEPSLRVGDAGIAIEKGGLQRVPWYAIEKIEWTGDALKVTAKDDAGLDASLVVRAKSHGQAAAWIVREARERVPDVVEIAEGTDVPQASTSAGQVMALEPMQVVGKHCAESGKVIAYEPDARACPRCERVYHKAHVPDTCACGAPIASLRPRKKDADEKESTE